MRTAFLANDSGSSTISEIWFLDIFRTVGFAAYVNVSILRFNNFTFLSGCFVTFWQAVSRKLLLSIWFQSNLGFASWLRREGLAKGKNAPTNQIKILIQFTHPDPPSRRRRKMLREKGFLHARTPCDRNRIFSSLKLNIEICWRNFLLPHNQFGKRQKLSLYQPSHPPFKHVFRRKIRMWMIGRVASLEKHFSSDEGKKEVSNDFVLLQRPAHFFSVNDPSRWCQFWMFRRLYETTECHFEDHLEIWLKSTLIIWDFDVQTLFWFLFFLLAALRACVM